MFSKKKKYILFVKPRLIHLLFLFYFICSIIKQTILKDIKEKNNLSIPILKLYVYDIGDFISLIPLLVIKIKSKSKNNDNDINNSRNNSKEGLDYIYTGEITYEYEKNRKAIILNIFLISIFDFVAQISTTVYYLVRGSQNLEVKQANLNSLLIFNVIFLFLFSHLILKTLFYRHHFFSFVIFIICLIVIVILDFIEINRDNSDKIVISIIYLLIRIFATMLYSLEDTIAKLMFHNYYFSPSLLLLIKAIIQFFYLIIFSIPLIYVKFKDEKGEEKILFSMFESIFNNRLYIFLYVLYMINSFFYNILNYSLIDVFSPNHTAIAKIFENFGVLIINVIEKDIITGYYIAIRFIMFIILILTSFIYNEFIVFNCCGLNTGTKLYLDYKEKFDIALIEETDSNRVTVDNNEMVSCNSINSEQYDED